VPSNGAARLAVSEAIEGRQVFPSAPTRRSLRVANQENWDLFLTSEIGTAENRWSGTNRTGWSHPEYDRLVAAYRHSIDRREMDRLSIQILKVLSDEVPGLVAYESPSLLAMAASLHGPEFGGTGTPDRPATTEFWDVEQWEFGR
jgi:ABC-type transport system substrate-binding protein